MTAETLLEGFRLSPQQRYLWSLGAQDGRYPHEVRALFRLRGDLDPERLRDAVRQVGERHEILRTELKVLPGMKMPLQVVGEEGPSFTILDAWSREADGLLDSLDDRLRGEGGHAGFYAAACAGGAGETWLLLAASPLHSDLPGLRNLARAILERYGALAGGQPETGEPLQYAELAEWQNGFLEQAQEAGARRFWHRSVPTLETPRLPYSHWRPLPGFAPALCRVELPAEVALSLAALAKDSGIPLTAWLLAVWIDLIERLSGEPVPVVGVAFDGRSYEGLEEALGPFRRVLPIATAGSSGTAGRDFAGRVAGLAAALEEAAGWQEYFSWELFEEAVTDGTVPYLPLAFEVREPFVPLRRQGVELSAVEERASAERFDLKLVVRLALEEPFALEIHFDARRFDGAGMECLAGQLASFAAASRSAGRLDEIEIGSAAERAAPTPACTPLPERIASWARRTPAAPALVGEGRQLTHGELDRRAAGLASKLRRLGVERESRVALCLARSPEVVVAMLATWKAGGAFAPLDPGQPRERLHGMLRRLAPVVLLTDAASDPGIDLPGTRVLRLDAEGRPGAGEEPEAAVSTLPEAAAYVLFTSGSTGRPKVVVVEHRQLASYVAAAERRLALPPGGSYATVSTFAADLGHTMVFPALASGGCLVVVAEDRWTDGERLAEELSRTRADTLKIVPGHLGALLAGKSPAGVLPRTHLIFGGEALPRDLVERVRAAAPDLHVFNHYGPTETTVGAVAGRVDDDRAPAYAPEMPLGRPLPGCRVHLAGPHLAPVTVWEPGEVLIGGAGVARGYLDWPEETAARFLPDPWGDTPGARLYRTGDLARSLPDGRLQFLGRTDDQVKIRGFRVELGEVATALLGHPDLAEAAVVAREERTGERRLVAYVVPRRPEAQGPVPEELRSFLRQRLPEAMVPAFVALPRLPRTANGKLDRRALPDPVEGARERVWVAPRTAIEGVLAALWSAVLGVEPIGVDDDFFALGGHSLLATQVIARVRAELGIELPLRRLFEAPTLAALALVVGDLCAQGRGSRAPIEPSPRSTEGPTDLPLSFAQRRLWFLDQLEPGNPFYNLSRAFRVLGPLAGEALRQGIGEVVRRHEMLRSVLVESVGGEPVQRVLPASRPVLPAADLTRLSPGDRESELVRLAGREARRRFDLARGPLLRLCRLLLGRDEQALVLSFHHVVSDAWSMDVLFRELSFLYPRLATGEPALLPPLPVQYGDFAAWQHRWLAGPEPGQQLAFWRRRLEKGPPVLELPTDRPRPAVLSLRGERLSFELSAERTTAVRQIARAAGATPFMVFLAAFQVLLARLTGQRQVWVGTPVLDRGRLETEGLIGIFLNMLLLEADLEDPPGFCELLRRTREEVLAATAHQDIPFEKLVEELAPERSLGRSPLFQVMFNYLRPPLGQAPIADLKLSAIALETGTARYEMTLSVVETERAAAFTVDFNRDLFDAATIRRFMGYFERFLAEVTEEPEQPVLAVPVLSPEERRLLLVDWNRSAVEHPEGDVCLHHLFERQAARTPDAVAVADEGSALCFAELERRSAALAGRCRGLGVGPEVPVGVLLERSVEMVAALLGVLRAGGAFVPLDPEHPSERLAGILAECRPPLLLARAAAPPGFGGRTLAVGEALSLPGASAGAAEAVPESLAYVLYTSGSTGRPKGVMISHRAIVNRVLWTQRAFPLSPVDRLLQKTSPVFDASLWEIFVPLACGARLVLARPDGHRDPRYLAGRLPAEGITVLQVVPSQLRPLLDEPELARADSLRFLFSGGEALSGELVERFTALRPGARVVNLYGPTEAAIDVTFHPCGEGRQRPVVPLGGPLANVRLYAVDAAGEPPLWGAAGELRVAGRGLARGYLGQPERTALSFVPDPFGDQPGGRLYRTGDSVRRLPGLELEFLGRLDHQVKLRGFRIELGEIEAALLDQPGVREAVVTVFGGDSDRQLVAYVAGPEAEALDLPRLREALCSRLPAYMVPALWVPLAGLPRTASGKVDRRALPAPSRGGGAREGRAPSTPEEQLVAALWEDLLGVEAVGAEDDFFALGGHSLLAARLISRLCEATGRELPLRAVFEAPTVASLAARLERSPAGADRPIEPAERPLDPEEGLPLSFAQEGLFFLQLSRPESPAFLVRTALRLAGDLAAGALAASLGEVVRRHEILRTAFRLRSGRPVQVVLAPAPVSLPVIDLAGLAPPGEAAARRAWETRLLAELAAGLAGRPLDLAAGRPFRAALVRLSPRVHAVLLVVHHACTDGWSQGVLAREVGAAYRAFSAGLPSPLPELPVQYADYAVWQRGWLAGAVEEEQLDHWRRRLAGAPPWLDLPCDRPRPRQLSARGDSVPFRLPEALAADLRRVARGRGATPFMLLLAAFKALLHRLTGSLDLVVGTDVANRGRREVEGLIGFFVNQLVLRTDLSGNPSFEELIDRARATALEAYSYQHVPFQKLVEALRPPRLDGRTPLYQVKLVLQNAAGERLDLPGLSVEPAPAGPRVAKYDLTLFVEERDGRLGGNFEYHPDLFDAATVERWRDGFVEILQQIAAGPAQRQISAAGPDAQRRSTPMPEKPRSRPRFADFKSALETGAPEEIRVAEASLIESAPLGDGGDLPLRISPAMAHVDLAEWAAGRKEWIDRQLDRHGALLFRGFGIDTPPVFEKFAAAVAGTLYDENGEHPRETVSGKVYTPVFFAPDKQLLWHNENSFNRTWPMKIFFACARPADQGGETSIVDSRRVYRELPDDLRRRFADQGVMYVRNYGAGVGRGWRDVFGTGDRAEVEARCREAGMELEWKSEDRLATRCVRPAVVAHPRTGEPVWFNQAQHWHVSCLEPATRKSLAALFAPADLPRHCLYGDGTEIADRDMETILDVYRRLEVVFPWQRGDVMLIDNVLTAHGRNPFVGERKILVALGEMRSFEEVS